MEKRNIKRTSVNQGWKSQVPKTERSKMQNTHHIDSNTKASEVLVNTNLKPYMIGGIKVMFPHEPYGSQKAVMHALIQSVKHSQNCLLDSPTGSGKTFALLCGALAWQCQEKERVRKVYFEERAKKKQEEQDAMKEEYAKRQQDKEKHKSFKEQKKRENDEEEENAKEYDVSKTERVRKVYFEERAKKKQEEQDAMKEEYAKRQQDKEKHKSFKEQKKRENDEEEENAKEYDVSKTGGKQFFSRLSVDGGKSSQSSTNLWEDDENSDFVLSPAGLKRKAMTIYKLGASKKTSHMDNRMKIIENLHNGNDSKSQEKPILLDPHTTTANIKIGDPAEIHCDSIDSNLLNNPNLFDEKKELAAVLAERVPKIFYGTRTHKQITNVVKELSKTVYKNVKMCILASREHTCIQSSNTRMNKTELCYSLLDPVAGKGCFYNKNVNRIGTHNDLARFGLCETFDIEDLVKLGKKVQACPYFATHSLMMTADIILCPYNYLIDPTVRSSFHINLNGSIILLDEAHNIEDVCRSAASAGFVIPEIIKSVDDCMRMAGTRKSPDEHRGLANFLQRLLNWIETNKTGSLKCFSGINLVAHFQMLSLGKDELDEIKDAFALVSGDNKNNDEKYKKDDYLGLSASTKKLIGRLLVQLDYLYQENSMEDFHAYIKDEGAEGDRGSQYNWFQKHNQQFQNSVIFKISCLNASIVFRELSMVRSIILSSGTLSPMDSFEKELGMNFNYKLEAKHVVDPSQVFVSTVARGPKNMILSNESKYFNKDELLSLLLDICKIVPHGVLCFVPSYWVLERILNSQEIISEIKKHKFLYSEPRDNYQLNNIMVDFYEKIELTENGFLDENNNNITGCLLFGVFRGKISEGIDFTDNQARTVVTFGLPFANPTDIEVQKKIEYNKVNCTKKNLVPSNKWQLYNTFRALNQAVGRCIRHKNDWGAIIILDYRFLHPPNWCEGGIVNLLPKWVKGQLQSYTCWKEVLPSLKEFIDRRKAETQM
uniref:Helicase ATP-binding domain-containing protein n=1 Tax=Clastoptera arizonana TaxID=38151 RepID=A0A1B6D3M4_9HEMI